MATLSLCGGGGVTLWWGFELLAVEEEVCNERVRRGAGFGILLCPPETTTNPSSSLCPSFKHLVTLMLGLTRLTRADKPMNVGL